MGCLHAERHARAEQIDRIPHSDQTTFLESLIDAHCLMGDILQSVSHTHSKGTTKWNHSTHRAVTAAWAVVF